MLRRDGLYRTDGDAEALRASFHALAHAAIAENRELLVNDRPIIARRCSEDVVWFDFAAICDGPRSAEDYIELARLFATVVVDGVPVFDSRKEDQARRFISLIDEFYDRNVKVLLSAAATVDDLYQGERLSAEFERTRSRAHGDAGRRVPAPDASAMNARWGTVVVGVLLAFPAAANTTLDDLEFKHGIAFFGELKYPPDFTHLDYLNPDAPKGGLLVEASQSAFNNLAPLAEGGIGAPSGFWFNADALLVRAGDEVSAFYGRLADGIAVTDDRLAMVFRIHPEARWRDGVPITSRDVVFTFNTLLDQVGGRMYLGFIASVEAIDDRHVAIHLNSPLTVNNVIMVQFTSILPAALLERPRPDRGVAGAAAVGADPTACARSRRAGSSSTSATPTTGAATFP